MGGEGGNLGSNTYKRTKEPPRYTLTQLDSVLGSYPRTIRVLTRVCPGETVQRKLSRGCPCVFINGLFVAASSLRLCLTVAWKMRRPWGKGCVCGRVLVKTAYLWTRHSVGHLLNTEHLWFNYTETYKCVIIPPWGSSSDWYWDQPT